MTRVISACVSSSATMMSERLSGSIWMSASPSWVLLRYWRVVPALLELELEPPVLLPVLVPVVRLAVPVVPVVARVPVV